MPTYTIKSPEGKIIKVQGDQPPSEQDMPKLFEDAKNFTQNPLTNEKPKSLISSIGNVLKDTSGFLSKIPGSPPTSEEIMKSTEGMNIPQKLISGAKGAVSAGAELLPYVFPVVKGSLLAQVGKQTAISGGSKFIEDLSKDKGFGESVKDALVSAGISGGIQGATPLVLKGLKEFGVGLAKAASSVRSNAIDIARKNPDILINKQPRVIDLATNIKQNLDTYANEIKEKYSNSISKLKVPEGFSIDASKIRDNIIEKDIPIENLKSKLLSSANRNIRSLDENTVDRFLYGGNLTFDEARKINTALFDITDSIGTQEIGTGGIGLVKGLKKEFLSILDSQVPGIKKINKDYSKSISFYDRLNSKFNNPQSAESLLNTIGAQLSGVKRAKTGVIDDLKILDGLTEGNFISQIPKSLAAEEFEKQGMTNLMDFLKLSSFASLGATSGSFGGAIGSGVGALAGSAASLISSKPEFVKQGILIGKKIAKPLQSEGSKRLLQLSSRTLGERL